MTKPRNVAALLVFHVARPRNHRRIRHSPAKPQTERLIGYASKEYCPTNAALHRCHSTKPLKDYGCNPGTTELHMPEPKIRKLSISGRELFILDNIIEEMMVDQVANLVRTLPYMRKEKSRPGVPGLAPVSDIPQERIPVDPFLCSLRQAVERIFPNEAFSDQRAYVNCSVYGDSYYLHRDCAAHEQHVTALYYANPEWKPDWGGETIYYNDEEDAELAISPRRGRLVIARGGILHRGSVPARNCYEERYTLAYKLNSVGVPPSADS